MNEPSDLPDGLKRLLDGAANDVAPAAAKAKARLALGLPPVAPVAPPPTQPPPAPPAGSAPAAGGGAASSGAASVAAGQGVALKLLAVVALAGGAFVTGVKVGDTRARNELALAPPPAVVAPAPVVPPPPVVVAPAPVVEPAPAAPTPPAPVEPPPAPAVPAKPKPAAAPEEDTLALELKLVEQARVALSQQQPAQALAALATYEQRVPKGALHDEAQLLKLEALVKAGRRAEAQALGDKLSRQTGSELVRDRIKGVLSAP